jgi:hypothetical protein
MRSPIERIESLRPALRFRVLGGGTDTDEREVVSYLGGASRADRYRLLVGESCVEGVGVGLLPEDQLRQLRKDRIRLSHRREHTNNPHPHL